MRASNANKISWKSRRYRWRMSAFVRFERSKSIRFRMRDIARFGECGRRKPGASLLWSFAE
jgi:hypothetical protein